MSTPMAHSLPDIFLTFPVAAPRRLTSQCTVRTRSVQVGHVWIKDTGPELLARPGALPFFFLSVVYRDSERFAVGTEPPPHQAPFTAHIPAALSEEPNFCSSYPNASVELQRGERRGMQRSTSWAVLGEVSRTGSFGRTGRQTKWLSRITIRVIAKLINMYEEIEFIFWCNSNFLDLKPLQKVFNWLWEHPNFLLMSLND